MSSASETNSGAASATKRRPMTLPEKILTHSAVGLKHPYVEPGQMICVKTQWTLACEITWKSMDKTYSDMGRPRIWRNDRFWLAIDHTVDPRVNHLPRQQMMIQASTNFAAEAKLTNFQKPNTTILHTEFYRQRAQPGQVVVGADSHSCSTGGLGAFAIGLGAADVVMPLVTGETWIQVPETVKIEFVNAPPFGLGGKDIMLYTLGQLKCNTVAIGRCVEWSGNIAPLSCDARFAIANMTAEFGGIAGIFPADERTQAYIAGRESHNQDALYFRADPDAAYAEVFQIDLANLEPQIALFPSPDNVQPVSAVLNMPLHGCFIGACTTAEEDLILGALVLEQCLKQGMRPVGHGERRVTPGSQVIIDHLRAEGLLEFYERAGFTVGAPGCSFCLGIAADVAKEGQVWLTSQNRNYRNRMGKGSIGHLASAVTVAASSFGMAITDPTPFLKLISPERLQSYLPVKTNLPPITIAVPAPELPEPVTKSATVDATGSTPEPATGVLEGRAQVFGDNIDTDAILPGEFLCENDVEALGKVAFLHTNPDFRYEHIICRVAGHGFGCGSSREQAVTCLKGAGVKAVIAKSFGYIFSRNVQMFALVGICITDDRFYELAQPNASIRIEMRGRTIHVAGETFRFKMSLFEEKLLNGGGIIPLYKKFGNRLFRVAVEDAEADDDAVACGTSSQNCASAGKAVDVAW
ncbi:hypothetical protein DYB32_000081 [Aphanomyces invadans]|uniref:Aconitate hydratase n=1 Tax=Aphanomyces invadans TaxID=157072 RepID=A0A418BB26_9STRA|nr:hypothetical protein DYB32_000081 [Aphanomyces invadans]